MLSRLFPQSLVARVYALYSIALLLFVSISLGLFYKYQYSQAIEDAQQSATMLVEVVAQTVTESAVIGDYDTIKRTLDKAILRSQFASAEFIDLQGGSLRSHNDNELSSLPPQWLQTLVSDQLYDINRVIIAGGADYGVLRLSFASDAIAENLWQLIRAALALALASFLGGLLLIWFPLKRWLGNLEQAQEIERNIRDDSVFPDKFRIEDLPLELQQTFTVLKRTADSLRKELDTRKQASQSLRAIAAELLPGPEFVAQAESDDITELSKVIAILVEDREAGRHALQKAKEAAEAANIAKGEVLAELDAIFKLSPDGLVSCDPQDRVKYANPAFLLMTSFLDSQVIGQPLAELERRLRRRARHPDEWLGFAPCFEKPPAHKAAAQRQLLALRKPRDVVLHFQGVNSDVAAAGRLLYVRDVTHEVEVDRMKSEFLSHAAHELRTPMASIYGFSELLMTQEFDEATRKDMLTTIYRQTSWLVEIINELLDLSRIESRRGKDFRIEAVAVAPLVSEVCDAMQVDAARWPVTMALPAGMPSVLADRTKLRQILFNVLGNAVKYSPQGGAIHLQGILPDPGTKGLAGIVVTDHGIGMTPTQLARVGERFFRADTSGNIPGSGLGMAIVKEVIELLGGRTDIASSPGVGTSVTLWLPTSEAAAPQAVAWNGDPPEG